MRIAKILVLSATIAAITAAPAIAQSRIQTGVLECLSNPTFGVIVGSVRTMTCVFKPTQARTCNR
jgi:hypothetical protein